jgi:hypothetical protein
MGLKSLYRSSFSVCYACLPHTLLKYMRYLTSYCLLAVVRIFDELDTSCRLPVPSSSFAPFFELSPAYSSMKKLTESFREPAFVGMAERR